MIINFDWFDELIDKYLSGTATEAERRLLDEIWIRMAKKRPDRLPPEKLEEMEARCLEKLLQHIRSKLS
ncbi:MAG: hypothetical protein E6Q24_15240 [Chitinophagaceae bacterium]|nr:MAG: hypothetical protein E6Q24_15240 [Chitinophagaceae bacterium]